METDADTKKVRIGTRSSSSMKKTQEFESQDAQAAAFTSSKMTISSNTKERGAVCVYKGLQFAGLLYNFFAAFGSDLDCDLFACSFFNISIIMGSQGWNRWRYLATQAVVLRIHQLLDSHAPKQHMPKLMEAYHSLKMVMLGIQQVRMVYTKIPLPPVWMQIETTLSALVAELRTVAMDIAEMGRRRPSQVIEAMVNHFKKDSLLYFADESWTASEVKFKECTSTTWESIIRSNTLSSSVIDVGRLMHALANLRASLDGNLDLNWFLLVCSG